jgi:hypothetical protein
MKPDRPIRASVAFLLAASAAAQAPPAPAEIREERVAEVLGYLASDALGGRDTPSPGLEVAAQYLAWSFASAGLEPGARVGEAPDWFHRYTLPGAAFDTAGATMSVTVDGETTALRPGLDFRIWESGRAFEAEQLPLVPEVPGADEDPRRARRAMAGRAPTFVFVAPQSTAWRAAAAGRQIVRRRALGGAPLVLLRDGLLDPGRALADLRVPEPREVEIPLKNVVGLLRGTDLADEYVLVTAHYDHVGLRPRADGGDGIYNGADDDASGTTAVLCLAEWFAARSERPRRSLVFVGFSAEEKGLRGSQAFVADPPLPLDKIAAVVNLEMLGRPEPDREPYAWVTGAALSDFAALAAPALARAGVGLVDFEMGPRLFFASDNLPFAQAGVVAHSISAGTLHADYHQPGDEADRVDLRHMTQVIRGLAEVVLAFADADARPAFTAEARQQLERRR